MRASAPGYLIDLSISKESSLDHVLLTESSVAIFGLFLESHFLFPTSILPLLCLIRDATLLFDTIQAF